MPPGNITMTSINIVVSKLSFKIIQQMFPHMDYLYKIIYEATKNWFRWFNRAPNTRLVVVACYHDWVIAARNLVCDNYVEIISEIQFIW